MKIKEAIGKVILGQNLTQQEARDSMQEIMDGKATDSQIAAFITALRFKGETVEEIVGCAEVMRDKATPISSQHSYLVDTCGTGGDNSNTFNISTTVAFVLAAGGVYVAKHGNRAVSSKSGSADLLEELGININLSPEHVSQGINNLGIGFLFAPLLHSAMKYAIGARKEIGIRTVFNILGPLTNPAKVQGQVLGVYNPNLTEVMAKVLGQLGVQKAFVVHGNSGLDEVSITGPTKISELSDGEVKTYYICPEDYGFKSVSLQSIKGGTVKENANITTDILKGVKGPHRDIVILNSAFGFLVAKSTKSVQEGIHKAVTALDSGAAYQKLIDLQQYTCKIAKECSTAVS